ncbi:MAG TPA: hypothetical protein VGM24_13355 [Puia sp.]
MKKIVILLASAILLNTGIKAEDASPSLMQAYVSRLEKVSSINEYQQLAHDFLRFARIVQPLYEPGPGLEPG